MIYFSSKSEVRDLLLFSICVNDKIKNLDLFNLLEYINICKIPKFPLTGDYLIEKGYEAGQTLGKKLKSLEDKWIKNNFILEDKFLKKNLGKSKKN